MRRTSITSRLGLACVGAPAIQRFSLAACSSSAAAAATCGHAIEVPLRIAHEPELTGQVLRMRSPGAARLGEESRSNVGPYEEKGEMTPADCLFGSDSGPVEGKLSAMVGSLLYRTTSCSERKGQPQNHKSCPARLTQSAAAASIKAERSMPVPIG